jgi:peptidoglycan/xylan/chitin deacetylase (PgdA/CDA1 family)
MLYRRLRGGGLVVLMLHRVREDRDPYPLSISRTTLREIVGWLFVRDALVSLDGGISNLRDRASSATQYAITLDDGYRDNLRMMEGELAQVPAVVYVATDHIGGEPIWAYRLTHAIDTRTRDHLDLGAFGFGSYDLSDEGERERAYAQLPAWLKQLEHGEFETCLALVFSQLQPGPMNGETREMMGWDDVRTLGEHGIEIGGHTCNHVLLSRVDDSTAREEIYRCTERISSELGVPPRHFAYPNGTFGDFGERDIRLIKRAGYATAATSIEGVNRADTDPFLLLRHNVHESRYRAPSGHLSKALFFSDTSGLLGWLRTRREA